ncbi:YitT family protein [Enterococcus canintestini]|nr:YitT family protein [Enterococcus canintestini]
MQESVLFKSEWRKISKILFGNSLLAIAYAKWMVPHKIINGGVTSLALVCSKLLGIDHVFLTNLITVLLLILCFCYLGKELLVKSFFSSICYLSFFSFFSNLPLRLSVNFIVDFSLACLFIAAGYYFCLSATASTVGMDVVALIIQQKRPKFQLATIIRNLNFVVLLLGFLVYGGKSVLIGVVFSFCYAFLLAKFLKPKEKFKAPKNYQNN